MKLTLHKTTNPISFAKAIRSYLPQFPLSEALSISKNLPYSFDIHPYDIDAMERFFGLYATVSKEKEPQDDPNFLLFPYNTNINPPPEYIEANAWYETLNDVEKKHVDNIVAWRVRPAVC